MLKSWLARLRNLWRLATSEHASPREVALAVGLGAFVGSTPAFAFHGWIALGAATALRLNRLYAFIGSRISSPFVYPFIVLAEIELAHWMRYGAFLALDHEHVLAQAKTLTLDWCIGSIPVGLTLGAFAGAIGFAMAKLRLRSRAAGADLTNKLLPDPRLSSECPPSDSPAQLS